MATLHATASAVAIGVLDPSLAMPSSAWMSPEVAGAIVGGTIGIVSATATALVNYYTTKRRLESKNRRRLAEFYLDKKVDALSEIHTRLTECYAVLGKALQNPSGYSWDRVREEIHAEIDAFEQAINAGDVYLTAEQETALRDTVDEYRSVADKVAILENGRRDMIDDVFDATEQAGGTLAEEINKPIKRLERATGDADDGSEADELADAERHKVPTGQEDSGWAALATQRDRLRDVFEVHDDGSVEFLVAVEPMGKALFAIVGQRYAYERDLVESPTVSENELVDLFDGSGVDVETFATEADEHLMSDDGEYYVEAEDLEGAIDWASRHVDDERATA